MHCSDSFKWFFSDSQWLPNCDGKKFLKNSLINLSKGSGGVVLYIIAFSWTESKILKEEYDTDELVSENYEDTGVRYVWDF